MAGAGDKAAAFVKGSGGKAKAAGVKVHSIATDPAVRAQAQRLIVDGRKVYQVITSPEAQRIYRQAADVLKKARKK